MKFFLAILSSTFVGSAAAGAGVNMVQMNPRMGDISVIRNVTFSTNSPVLTKAFLEQKVMYMIKDKAHGLFLQDGVHYEISPFMYNEITGKIESPQIITVSAIPGNGYITGSFIINIIGFDFGNSGNGGNNGNGWNPGYRLNDISVMRNVTFNANSPSLTKSFLEQKIAYMIKDKARGQWLVQGQDYEISDFIYDHWGFEHISEPQVITVSAIEGNGYITGSFDIRIIKEIDLEDMFPQKGNYWTGEQVKQAVLDEINYWIPNAVEGRDYYFKYSKDSWKIESTKYAEEVLNIKFEFKFKIK